MSVEFGESCPYFCDFSRIFVILPVYLWFCLYFCYLVTVRASVSSRVFQKNTFFKKIKSTTHHTLAWGLVWKNPWGFFISISLVVPPALPFCPFLHCRFSLGPLMTGLREGWVKIYNVKMVKIEVAGGTPKLYRNQ